MASKALPCPTVLRQLLRYEPETGKLFWKARTPDMFRGWGRGKNCTSPEWRCDRWNKRYAETETGAIDIQSGYVRVFISDKHHYAHRAIWQMMHGEIPDEMQIDHANGNRSDNRAGNLASATVAENSRNVRLRDNTSGVTGVYWSRQRGKWQAKIQVDGKPKHLGFHDRLSSAIDARAVAEKKYGYHENHGTSDRPKYRSN